MFRISSYLLLMESQLLGFLTLCYRLIPVGITDEVNLPQLVQMTTNANDVVTVKNFNILNNELNRLLEITCSIYIITP